VRLKAKVGWDMPWYTIMDSFDVDFGVHLCHQQLRRQGDGSTWSYLDATPLGRQETWEDSSEGYPSRAVQMVELARIVLGRRRA
jgi:predicted dithiol-disulfide oxidoreductase (DUF899 family)